MSFVVKKFNKIGSFMHLVLNKLLFHYCSGVYLLIKKKKMSQFYYELSDLKDCKSKSLRNGKCFVCQHPIRKTLIGEHEGIRYLCSPCKKKYDVDSIHVLPSTFNSEFKIMQALQDISESKLHIISIDGEKLLVF